MTYLRIVDEFGIAHYYQIASIVRFTVSAGIVTLYLAGRESPESFHVRPGTEPDLIARFERAVGLLDGD